MANKRLSDEQIEELKKMIIKGVYPDDIAHYFGTAVSTVHNYKNRLKKEGLKFPSVKGKRPHDAPQPEDIIQKLLPENRSNVIGVKNFTDKLATINNYKFIINGISVIVDHKAKSVNITEEFMEIKF